MEPNRSWHDPVVEIFGNLITPGVRYSAEAYDLANRRWYRLNVTEPDVPDDDWISATVAEHIKAYYAAHGEVPQWNTITLPAHEGPAAYESRGDSLVGRPIKASLSYGASPTDRLPTAPIHELQRLTYISRSADRCVWRGRDCVCTSNSSCLYTVSAVSGAVGSTGAPGLLLIHPHEENCS